MGQPGTGSWGTKLGGLKGGFARRSWPALPVAWQQSLAMVAILLVTAALAQVGLGVFGRLFFLVAGLAMAWFYLQRSPWHYVTVTLWFWTLTPLARRLIDFGAGFDPINYVLGAPNLLALLMLRDVLSSRDLLRRPEAALGMFAVLPIFYGLVVNLVQGDVVPAVAGAADWVAPLLYYFFVLANWRQAPAAVPALRAFAEVNALVLVVYGIAQYFAPAPWDVAWVRDSGLTSIGSPEPYALRIFGTLNLPGVLAVWLGALLLLWLELRTRLTVFLAPAAALLLLMTLVRSVLGTLVLGLLLAAVMGRASVLKVLGMAALAFALLGGVVSVVNPDMAERLLTRLDTLGSLQTDQSALERQALYRSAPALIDNNPLGVGLGGIGRGAVTAQNADRVSIDSGPIAIFLTLGWVGGAIYLTGITLVLAQAVLAARSVGSPAILVLAIAAVATSANLLFANMTGLFAVVVWGFSALATSLGIAQRDALASVALNGRRARATGLPSVSRPG